VVNDVNEAIGGGNVRLDDCCINAAALNRNRLVVAAVGVQHVEVEELLVDIRRHLNNLPERAKTNGEKGSRSGMEAINIPDCCSSESFRRSIDRSRDEDSKSLAFSACCCGWREREGRKFMNN
jgi:hypothetical protein